MAWQSGGNNNTEMVDNLKRFEIISSDHVEKGLRSVDRICFVPPGHTSMAHADTPLREGNVHISAPHVYGLALEAIDLVPNASISFLNIGSGTGYISCVAAEILGRNSLNYGVELRNDVIDHCKASIAKWKTNTVEENSGIFSFHFGDNTADITIIRGNGLNISRTMGEGKVGFDRIFLGAAIDKGDLFHLTKLLSPGGILVGPVVEDLIKVVRVGNISLEEDGQKRSDHVFGLSKEFTSEILSCVRFTTLVTNPVMKTIIPENVWNPNQHGYPSEFKLAGAQLLMCSNSELYQPPPRVPSQEERLNAAAMLPKSLWLEILSYTHRKWFKPEQDEVEYLKQRLREEKAKATRAERARKEAEERCDAVEKDRALYRYMARRWQSRLNTLLNSLHEGHSFNVDAYAANNETEFNVMEQYEAEENQEVPGEESDDDGSGGDDPESIVMEEDDMDEYSDFDDSVQGGSETEEDTSDNDSVIMEDIAPDNWNSNES